MPYTFPPAAPTVSGDNITASRFLNSTPLVARRLRTLAEQRFVSLSVLTGRTTTSSGSLQLETNEGIYTDRAVEVVAPGSEYPLTTITSGPIQQVSTQKWGQDTLFTDEAIARYAMANVDKGLHKLVNTAAKNIDGLSLSLIASSVTQTQGTAGTNNWTAASGATILRDLMNAKATLAALNQGYDAGRAARQRRHLGRCRLGRDADERHAARVDRQPGLLGRAVHVLAGVRIVPTPNLPAAGGWLLDSSSSAASSARASAVATRAPATCSRRSRCARTRQGPVPRPRACDLRALHRGAERRHQDQQRDLRSCDMADKKQQAEQGRHRSAGGDQAAERAQRVPLPGRRASRGSTPRGQAPRGDGPGWRSDEDVVPGVAPSPSV
jgi:hypothetical protein